MPDLYTALNTTTVILLSISVALNISTFYWQSKRITLQQRQIDTIRAVSLKYELLLQVISERIEETSPS